MEPIENTNQADAPKPAETQVLTAPKQKTAVGKILSEIGHAVEAPFQWGAKEFGVITKSFQNEVPEVQTALTSVSGMLQIIKLNLQETPAVIIYLVKKAYPQFDEAKIFTMLQDGINDLALVEKIDGHDLPALLTAIKTHTLGGGLVGESNEVTPLTNTGWNVFWDAMWKAISVAVSPGTPWQKIVTYAAYIYQVLVKPNVK